MTVRAERERPEGQRHARRVLGDADNLRRAGLVLRAIAGGAGWTRGVFVEARKATKDRAVVVTDEQLAELESFLVEQGWLMAEGVGARRPGWFALTQHGLDESFRKLDTKPTKPVERAE